MLVNSYPRFPQFYYIVGANFGLLLHGDVSVRDKAYEILMVEVGHGLR